MSQKQSSFGNFIEKVVIIKEQKKKRNKIIHAVYC